MASTSTQTPERQPEIAQVRDKTRSPEGVVSRRSQQYLVLGIAVVIVLVAMFSSNRRKAVAAAQGSATVPIHESNPRKLADYRDELVQQQRAAESGHALPVLPPPSNPPSGNERQEGSTQGTSKAELQDAIDAKDQERRYNARFASNIAFSASRAQSATEAHAEADDLDSRVEAPIAGRDKDGPRKRVNVNVNSASGQPYVLFEGSMIETTLVNRLDGDFSGPVKVMVTNPMYSHDRQHVLIPEGTNILGEVRPVQGLGQRRLAVIFHRMIMPDGYSVDLDQFHGLNQVGETGLRDKVNNHYLQIFGISIALGVIAGAAEASNGNAGVYANGTEAYRQGVASSVSQSSTRILDRFLSINPTLTIREGHRVKVYLTNDLLLPAYENHTVPPNI